MNDEKVILLKLNGEEVNLIVQVLDAFQKLAKIAPAKGKKKERLKITADALIEVIDKINKKIEEVEEKEKNKK